MQIFILINHVKYFFCHSSISAETSTSVTLTWCTNTVKQIRMLKYRNNTYNNSHWQHHTLGKKKFRKNKSAEKRRNLGCIVGYWRCQSWNLGHCCVWGWKVSSNDTKSGKFNVRCLEKPLCITGPQLKERDAIDYDYAYKTNIQPKLADIDANGKKTRSWFWVY